MRQGLRLAFLGHSTVLIEIEGLRILTDPILVDRGGPLRRVVEPIDPELYAGIDLVLLSHLHLDHFDVGSLRLLGPDTHLVVPTGAGFLLDRLGFKAVEELGPGDRIERGAVAVTATTAVHGGFRPPAGPRAAAVGYAIESPPARIYFAGDTDLFPGMADLAPIDVALLPVWGWGPRLGPGHLDPARATQAVGLLRARYVVPIHWGTLWPRGLGRIRPGRLTEPPHEFATLVGAAHPQSTIVVTPPGRVVDFESNDLIGWVPPL
jgi:L-ascorbate metabolism protein UlaG (beta-lactamase superfamily)